MHNMSHPAALNKLPYNQSCRFADCKISNIALALNECKLPVPSNPDMKPLLGKQLIFQFEDMKCDCDSMPPPPPPPHPTVTLDNAYKA